MKLLGRNIIPVLCTLFLLSYTKILKTIITILTFTEVFEGNADEVEVPLIPHKVWLYDGNVYFLTERYVALFSVALFFLIILFLPYTLLLTFGQFLRSMQKIKCLKRIFRSIAFISIMDAYHAPFKKKHRYWAGLFLFTRCILFTTFLNSYFESKLLAIALVTFALLAARALNDTYSSYVVNLLEISYFSNLGILAIVMPYLGGKQNPGPATCICITASIAIAFLSFACTLVVHIYLYLLSTSKVVLAIKNRFQKEQKQDNVDLVTPPRPADSAPKPHTTTVISMNLREPLLEQ